MACYPVIHTCSTYPMMIHNLSPTPLLTPPGASGLLDGVFHIYSSVLRRHVLI